jgi:hypothetical protein
MKHFVQVTGRKPRISSQPTQDAVHAANSVPTTALTAAARLPRHSGRLVGDEGRIRMGRRTYGHGRLVQVSTLLMVALSAGATILGGGRAWADPANADRVMDGAPPPTADVAIPSSPPATAQSTDGWTLTLSANSETQTPAPALDPAVPSRDFIVGGLFNGTLRGPNHAKTPTPSGTIEVGYQIQCVGGGLLAAMKPSIINVKVLKEDFKEADPSAAVTAFRVQVDCARDAFIRSYAILIRSTDGSDAAIAYYGVSMPV